MSESNYLSYFKQSIIERAYYYYENDYVHNLHRENGHVITAAVEGSGSVPYNVRIDLMHPHASECTCPYAEKGKMCKHMAAVFFTAFPEEAREYEEYLEGEDYDAYQEDFAWDENERDHLPANFEHLLDMFLSALDEREKAQLLREELMRHPSETYDTYLRQLYQKSRQNEKVRYIDSIHDMMSRMAPQYASSSADFEKPVLTDAARKELDENEDPEIISDMVRLLKDVRLYSFADAVWMAKYLCRYDTAVSLGRFRTDLEDQAGLLWEVVHPYGRHPLDNLLPALYELSDEQDADQLAFELLRYVQFPSFAEYVIDHEKDVPALYAHFRDQMSRTRFNQRAVHHTLHLFADKLGKQEIHDLADYYDFVYNFNRAALDRLRGSAHFTDVFLDKLLQQKPHIVKETLAVLHRTEQLFAFLKKENDIWGMIQYAPLLDEKYHQELADIFTKEFYDNLKNASQRTDYAHACQYIRALATLAGGDEIIDHIVSDLQKQDQYVRRRALFEEIAKAR
ncbi:MAG: SWIM zinc finger family protein [Solobacterium sp.]|nr:SWIM zinc finger family protein [Solobacterium sp.]